VAAIYSRRTPDSTAVPRYAPLFSATPPRLYLPLANCGGAHKVLMAPPRTTPQLRLFFPLGYGIPKSPTPFLPFPLPPSPFCCESLCESLFFLRPEKREVPRRSCRRSPRQTSFFDPPWIPKPSPGFPLFSPNPPDFFLSLFTLSLFAKQPPSMVGELRLRISSFFRMCRRCLCSLALPRVAGFSFFPSLYKSDRPPLRP